MNLFECKNKAQEVGFDSYEFVAYFPVGPVKCRWLDAYMGMFVAYYEDMDQGFLTVNQIHDIFPDIECKEIEGGDTDVN